MAEGGFTKFFKGFTYEIKCDETNEISEPEEFKQVREGEYSSEDGIISSRTLLT